MTLDVEAQDGREMSAADMLALAATLPAEERRDRLEQLLDGAVRRMAHEAKQRAEAHEEINRLREDLQLAYASAEQLRERLRQVQQTAQADTARMNNQIVRLNEQLTAQASLADQLAGWRVRRCERVGWTLGTLSVAGLFAGVVAFVFGMRWGWTGITAGAFCGLAACWFWMHAGRFERPWDDVDAQGWVEPVNGSRNALSTEEWPALTSHEGRNA